MPITSPAWIEEDVPDWWAESSNPDIGNGTLKQRYRRRDGAADYLLELVGGSTTDFGDGDWLFNVGQTVLSDQGFGWALLTAQAYDASAGQWYSGLARLDQTLDFDPGGYSAPDPPDAYLRLLFDPSPDRLHVVTAGGGAASGIGGATDYVEFEQPTTPPEEQIGSAIEVDALDGTYINFLSEGTYAVSAQCAVSTDGGLVDITLADAFFVGGDGDVAVRVQAEVVAPAAADAAYGPNAALSFSLVGTGYLTSTSTLRVGATVYTVAGNWSMNVTHLVIQRLGGVLTGTGTFPFPWAEGDRLLIGNVLQSLDT